jgi:hypothetical protein
MRRDQIGGRRRREFGKSRCRDDIGGENDHREKFHHDASLVGVDLHFAALIASLR